MGKNFVNFLFLFTLFFTEMFVVKVASAAYKENMEVFQYDDPCPEGSYQVPLSGNKKFRSIEHVQLAQEGTGLIRGLSSIRSILSSHWSRDDLIMCFSGIVLNRRRVGHHGIFGQYKTYQRDNPDRVVSLIPLIFNAAALQGFHGIKEVDEENPHVFEDPHIFKDPRETRAEYAKMILNADFSSEVPFPDFSLQSLREKIREAIDPRIKDILNMTKEDYQRRDDPFMTRFQNVIDPDFKVREDGKKEEIFTGRIFIMRIETESREDTDTRYYLVSWVKEISKGDFMSPVGLHAMLIRYSVSDEALSFSKFGNAKETVMDAFVDIPSLEYFRVSGDVVAHANQ